MYSVEMTGIVKRYGDLAAVDHVDFASARVRSTVCWGRMEQGRRR